MLKKIISGGQTGADRAALDAALEVGIEDGGWVPKGRKAEDGRISDKYNLKEMPTSSYPKRTEQNVIDSDATLIFSRGKLTGGSLLTQKVANRHKKLCKHTDLNKCNAFQAARDISIWIDENHIEVLNVAGPRASKDPKIYDAVHRIMATVCHLIIMITGNPGSATKPYPIWLEKRFTTVEEAADDIINGFPLEERVQIANIDENDLYTLEIGLTALIRDRLQIWVPNKDLLESCRAIAGDPNLDMGDAPNIIIKEVWRRLRGTHRMRVVK